MFGRFCVIRWNVASICMVDQLTPSVLVSIVTVCGKNLPLASEWTLKVVSELISRYLEQERAKEISAFGDSSIGARNLVLHRHASLLIALVYAEQLLRLKRNISQCPIHTPTLLLARNGFDSLGFRSLNQKDQPALSPTRGT
mgnify:CR=1 FL=1